MTTLPDYPEASLTTATAVALGGRLYVFGGARWDAAAKTVVNHDAAHVFDATAGQWRALPRLPQPGRGLAAVALDDQANPHRRAIATMRSSLSRTVLFRRRAWHVHRGPGVAVCGDGHARAGRRMALLPRARIGSGIGRMPCSAWRGGNG
jgi:hypothetical protein